MRNEQGVTLIEVLAALSILSIIGVTIWQVFIQGNQYSQISVTKNKLQQEANIVISTLTKIHQTNEKYTLKSSECTITVLDKNHTEIQSFSSSSFCYKAENQVNDSEISSITLEPSKKGNDLQLIVNVSDIRNLGNKVSVKILLYRLKGGEVYE